MISPQHHTGRRQEKGQLLVRFRVSSIIALVWGLAFFALPRVSNKNSGIDYEDNLHAEDWTRLLGLSFFAFAYLLHGAQRSANQELRQTIARGVLIVTFSGALVMTYWQIIPDGRWNRLDLANAAILYALSYGLLMNSGGLRRGAVGDAPATPPTLPTK